MKIEIKNILILFLFGIIQCFIVIVCVYLKYNILNDLSKAPRALIYLALSTLILITEYFYIEREIKRKLKFSIAILIGSVTIGFSFGFAHLIWYMLGYLDKTLTNFIKQTFIILILGIVLSLVAYILLRLKSSFIKKHSA